MKNGRAEEILLSINDSEYADLQPAFDLYQSKTGLHIDQYSDLKISSGVQPLIDSLEAKSTGNVIFSSLLNVLKQSEAAGYGIIFVGD